MFKWVGSGSIVASKMARMMAMMENGNLLGRL